MTTKPDIEVKEFRKMKLTHELKPGKKNMIMGSDIEIEDLVGKIEPNMRRFGFTAGQFSFSDLIEYILNRTGPAMLYISTWAASNDGIKKVFDFLDNEMLTDVRFMIDTGAKKYRDDQFGKLLNKFGDCVRTTRIHAKFAVIRNDDWDIVIRTSANLNKNLRLENFEIDEDKEFADFFQKFFDEAFKKISVSENHRLESSQKLKSVINAAGGRESVEIDMDKIIASFDL